MMMERPGILVFTYFELQKKLFSWLMVFVITILLCVETLGRINPILCPHFMPLLDVTVHLCSLER